ncbi:hypothetical protein [Pyruvatibacter mobilis]|uniref:hypothetical protein n=1 Tax=Pyruvatibacter mobilis TaxID=1712261 RepID=UPI003BA89CB3
MDERAAGVDDGLDHAGWKRMKRIGSRAQPRRTGGGRQPGMDGFEGKRGERPPGEETKTPGDRPTRPAFEDAGA